MGKYRSKSGCLTCRKRRVKCDEEKPVCGNCGKKNRDCQWETQETTFRGYRPPGPGRGSSSGTVHTEPEEMNIDPKDDQEDGDVALTPIRRRNNLKSSITAGRNVDATMQSSGRATAGLQDPSPSAFLPIAESSSINNLAGGRVAVPATFSTAVPSKEPVPLIRRDAMLVHHYSEHLGRWLDGTDAARQFTLTLPEQVKHCSILLHAVLCFAARHIRDDVTAQEAYTACLNLVIERLNLNTALHDDDLLCAIVILRFFEQLNVPTESGSDEEQHLVAGTSAILRSSYTTTVDPSAPTLREAAFWIYVRQCLYNATVNQQPPNIDFAVQLLPLPHSMKGHHPLARLRLETAWANQMTWNCARVTDFCFGKSTTFELSLRMSQWQALWDDVQNWNESRPRSFDPIWRGHSGEYSVFPEMIFTADWHVVSYGFYHFCCILLLNYKPGPRFARRSWGHKLSDEDHQALQHAREICGSVKSSPEAVSALITFCHTIFVWGPILTDATERDEVLGILANLERAQRWPTAWIISALKTEWGIE
ncbi:hypothetical protein BU23DRAFT_133553 [Bimuria novae-zelandiae CBS 107.79]|uniref:Zn(2)-C6 fungal-type domain-containing protein n=1 Tax=Bimuria novae-zelandiae CBS 107.79 TaxID=1447943 RepID=A0A6A5VJQ6_9PLEO|nr:hypothetical protein BU23DRAFT_133553 [Bimuria novae-zelandiae CBS 107.79]